MFIPFSSDDLRAIADNLDEWNAALIDKNGEYKTVATLVNKIPFTRPDIDTLEIVGEFVLDDGWIGVTFRGES